MIKLEKAHPIHGNIKVFLSFCCYSEEDRQITSVAINKESNNFSSCCYIPVSEVEEIVSEAELNMLLDESIETRHRLDREREERIKRHFEQWQNDKNSASKRQPQLFDRVIKTRYSRVNYGKVVGIDGTKIQVNWEESKNSGRSQYKTWVKATSVRVL